MGLLSEKVAEQSRFIDAVRAYLLRDWGGEDVAKFWDGYSLGDEGNLERECDLRREGFELAAEEARRRMARRQARKEMLVEIAHMVAERGGAAGSMEASAAGDGVDGAAEDCSSESGAGGASCGSKEEEECGCRGGATAAGGGRGLPAGGSDA